MSRSSKTKTDKWVLRRYGTALQRNSLETCLNSLRDQENSKELIDRLRSQDPVYFARSLVHLFQSPSNISPTLIEFLICLVQEVKLLDPTLFLKCLVHEKNKIRWLLDNEIYLFHLVSLGADPDTSGLSAHMANNYNLGTVFVRVSQLSHFSTLSVFNIVPLFTTFRQRAHFFSLHDQFVSKCELVLMQELGLYLPKVLVYLVLDCWIRLPKISN